SLGLRNPMKSPLSGATHAIAVSDFNGDSKLDLVLATGDGNLSVLMGNGDGTFANAATYRPPSSPSAFAVADFNADGWADLAACGPAGVTIWLGNGDGSFQTPATYSAGSNGWGPIVSADFNGDGKADLAMGVQGTTVGVAILPGNGDGSFG